MSQGTFKPGERLGASTLIKRLWHQSFLPGADGLGVSETQLRTAMPMPNTHSIAAGTPFAQEADGSDEADGTDSTDKGKKYYAILALDGDEMGKWISGSKSPEMGHCLSPNAVDYYRKHSPAFLEAPRAVTPSWHLQFSEALGNFSLHAAQRVVEAFNGRLIYAGGDDVLAMLPATEALACARALRAAFRGESALNTLAKGKLDGRGTQRRSDRTTQLFDMRLDGCLQLHPDSGAKSGDKAKLLSDPVKFPALVPGPAADVSVGIAIAHFKSPLQDVVRQAQLAEKRAKRAVTDGGFGRAAVAISLVKRSGEILEWGCKWSTPEQQDSAGYQLLHTLIDALNNDQLNSRFPHKLEALLVPYLPGSSKMTDDASFEGNFAEILAQELDHCLGRNAGGKLDKMQRQLFTDYWLELCRPDPKDAGKAQAPFKLKLTRFINLLRTASWMKAEETTKDSSSAINSQPALA
jgi:hypothetical protein